MSIDIFLLTQKNPHPLSTVLSRNVSRACETSPRTNTRWAVFTLFNKHQFWTKEQKVPILLPKTSLFYSSSFSHFQIHVRLFFKSLTRFDQPIQRNPRKDAFPSSKKHQHISLCLFLSLFLSFSFFSYLLFWRRFLLVLLAAVVRSPLVVVSFSLLIALLFPILTPFPLRPLGGGGDGGERTSSTVRFIAVRSCIPLSRIVVRSSSYRPIPNVMLVAIEEPRCL